jgi:DNA-directed RNA polymerase specialized sigma24 family protein
VARVPVQPRVDRPPPEAEEAETPARTAPAEPFDDQHAWLDQEAGPVVRPYTLTGGRSHPVTTGLNLLTHVETLYAPEADLMGLQPEHREILDLARTATSLAELAARLDLPLGVVRVLVGDLLQANLVSTFEADAAVRAPDDDILRAVIDGLRAL